MPQKNLITLASSGLFLLLEVSRIKKQLRNIWDLTKYKETSRLKAENFFLKIT